MSEYPLGWQSWSPPAGTLSCLPRDYRPLPVGKRSNNLTIPQKSPIVYWCSWYALGKSITYANILNQAKLIKKYELGITHILIDDGWYFTDWLKPLIDQLHSIGFKVGIWYAPYTKHKLLPHQATLTKLIVEYQVDLIKLDFLYKPFFEHNLIDDSIPHAQLLKLFTFLSSKYPKVYTIACGCPFDSGIGNVDAIRISKDTILPPNFPHFLCQLSYKIRMKLLHRKWGLIPSNFISTPDPDVRMFTYDTQETASYWSTIHSNCLGIGDNFELLTTQQIKEARIWIQKNLTSRSSSRP